MEDQVKEILLNGMTIPHFMALYGAAILGGFTLLLIKTYIAIAKDPETPNSFSWRYAVRGLVKLLISLIIIPWSILYFQDYGPTILDILFIIPEEGTLIELNPGSAFILGLSIDAVIRKLTDNKFKKSIII